MDLRVARLRSAAEALRTEMEALAVQLQRGRQTLAGTAAQHMACDRQAQLAAELADLDARVSAVEEYRAARSSKWGSELSYDVLGAVLQILGWGGPECKAVRLVSAGWCSAHDLMCPELHIRSWNWPDSAADTLKQLERVTAVSVSYSSGLRREMATCMPLLRNLPSLTGVLLDFDDVLSKVEAKALGGLTTLSSLTLVRDLEHQFGYDDDFVYGFGFDGDLDEHEEAVDEYLQELFVEHTKMLRSYARKDRWAAALSPLTNLTHLDLSMCQNLTAETLLPLSKLTALTALELRDEVPIVGGEFDYYHYGIGSKAMTAVAAVSSLTSLELKECNRVTDKGLAKLARLPALTSLRLVRCDSVSAKVVKTLKAAIPSLVIERITEDDD
jgi:hypothetical protein